MIKYPLYQFPVNSVTPFDEYKTAAHGDAILDAVETQIELSMLKSKLFSN